MTTDTIREAAARAAREKKMKNRMVHGVRVMSKYHPLSGTLKYHVFDVDEVEPFCHRPVRGDGGWDWTRAVPWNRIPEELKCPTCLRFMLEEDGNRWGIK